MYRFKEAFIQCRHFFIGCEFLQHFSELWCDSKNISSTMDCFAILSSYYAESMYITRGKKTKQIGNQYQRGHFGKCFSIFLPCYQQVALAFESRARPHIDIDLKYFDGKKGRFYSGGLSRFWACAVPKTQMRNRSFVD